MSEWIIRYFVSPWPSASGRKCCEVSTIHNYIHRMKPKFVTAHVQSPHTQALSGLHPPHQPTHSLLCAPFNPIAGSCIRVNINTCYTVGTYINRTSPGGSCTHTSCTSIGDTIIVLQYSVSYKVLTIIMLLLLYTVHTCIVWFSYNDV